MGPAASPAVPTLVGLLESKEGETDHDILYCLARIGPAARASVPTLRRLLKAESLETRLEAAAALLCISPGDNAAMGVLKAAFKDSGRARAKASFTAPQTVRELAIETLSRMGVTDNGLIPHLIAFLDDAEEPVRTAAALYLSVFGSAAARAIPSLERILARDDAYSGAAAVCLMHIGKESLPILMRVARNRELAQARCCALHALGGFPEDGRDILPTLVSALIDDETRVSALIALGNLGKSARPAVPALLLLSLCFPVGPETNPKDSCNVYDTAMVAWWAAQQTSQ
jgi:HEAT repeat protein